LPDLEGLGVAEKDDLIRSLCLCVVQLTAKLAERESRLALNCRNSSKPPSSEGYDEPKPKPKSLRGVGKNPTGGQKGHAGHTLEKSEHPDHLVIHAPPAHCGVCHVPLSEAQVVETRQVFDLLPTRYEVTGYWGAAVPAGRGTKGRFPRR